MYNLAVMGKQFWPEVFGNTFLQCMCFCGRATKSGIEPWLEKILFEPGHEKPSYKGAHQCFWFCYIHCTIRLLPKSEISSLWLSSVVVQPELCKTWSETRKKYLLVMWLKGCLKLTKIN